MTLRKFANHVANIIIAWERLGETQYFYSPQRNELAETYISSIDKDVNRLRDLLGSLKDQTKLFEDMTTNVYRYSSSQMTRS
jgi:spermidine/putrescine-binding protein